jgi:DNA-binding NtrC family response regulator
MKAEGVANLQHRQVYSLNNRDESMEKMADTTVLVVDDEEGIRKSVATYLELNGYKAFTAGNAREAYERVKKGGIQIVLMDINMPGLDGIEALQAMKTHDYTIQVIMMTASASVDKTMGAMESGASDFLIKPFDSLEQVGELVRLSKERLDRWRQNIDASVARQKKL